jgi:hypothetical protein
MTLRAFSLATLMRAIKVAEARFLEGRVNGMNADTTYKSRYMEQIQREVRGVLAEFVIGRRFDKYFFPTVNTFHGPADVSEDIEVRSTEHADGALIFRDNDDPARRFVLVHVELNENKSAPKMGFAVRGWAWGAQVALEQYYDNGSGKNGKPKGRPSCWYYGPFYPIASLTYERPADAPQVQECSKFLWTQNNP